MNPKGISLDFTCQACGSEFPVFVSHPTPAKTDGPPEHCYPAEGGDIEPQFCPNCNAELDQDEILNLYVQEAEAQAQLAADYYHDLKIDRQMEAQERQAELRKTRQNED